MPWFTIQCNLDFDGWTMFINSLLSSLLVLVSNMSFSKQCAVLKSYLIYDKFDNMHVDASMHV